MIHVLAAILFVWLATAVRWWVIEDKWNGGPVHPVFRFYRAVDWLPCFLHLPPLGGGRFYVWMIDRYIVGDGE